MVVAAEPGAEPRLVLDIKPQDPLTEPITRAEASVEALHVRVLLQVAKRVLQIRHIQRAIDVALDARSDVVGAQFRFANDLDARQGALYSLEDDHAALRLLVGQENARVDVPLVDVHAGERYPK